MSTQELYEAGYKDGFEDGTRRTLRIMVAVTLISWALIGGALLIAVGTTS